MSVVPATVTIMDLEVRVTAVEVGLAAVREVEIPALRAEMEQRLIDVRAETRGWAELAVKTASKMDHATEIIHLIHEDTRETRNGLAQLQTEFSGLKSDVSGLKSDVSELKTDVSGLRTDVAEILAKLS
jgi:chromosome segregation ATPase